MKKALLILVLCSWILYIQAQENSSTFTQVVKGTILDGTDNAPIVGAIIFFEEDPTKGTISDSLGRFIITHSTGRYTLNISMLGYESQSFPVFLNTVQEYFLDVSLEPRSKRLSEASVTAPFQKERPINKLVYSSGRSFSTEEAYRYAGTLGDAARMVRSYAGVVPPDDSRNDIIIRGNSPTGLLWRVDGIEIANPNHYSSVGLTGSTITLLNTNMMSNSDFLTGAFPAEYGNALSGVFDLRMKTVHPEKYRFRFGTSWNGFEFGAEGPFSKKQDIGTFQVCYRYSFMDVMSKIGWNTGVIPKYQDFTAKTEFHLTEKLKLSFLALWGTSLIDLNYDIHSLYTQSVHTGSDMMLGGLTLNYQANEKTVYTLIVSASNSQMQSRVDTIHTENREKMYNDISGENKYSISANVKTRLGKKQFLTAGLHYDLYDVNYFQENTYNEFQRLDTAIYAQGKMSLYRMYVQDEFRINDAWKISLGLHGQLLDLNRHYAIEPRAGILFKPSDKHRIGVAFGNHHQMQVRNLYFLQNEQLDFSAAKHYNLTHDWQIDRHLRLKTDVYYQALSNIPVENDANSSFSVLNLGSDFYIPLKENLVNKGKGRNYGAEITLEKFMNDHYYYMVNATAYRSEYTGGDGIWRSTCYDMRYIANGLFGYEWWVSSDIALCADFKVTYAGGKPYTPVNESLSQSLGQIIYDENKIYAERYPAYFRPDLKFTLKINYQKLYYEFGMDFQNFINHHNVLYTSFMPSTGQYEYYYQTLFYPMVTFKLLF